MKMTMPNSNSISSLAEVEVHSPLRQRPRRRRHGGGLRVCGCLWRIASDDFVFPALFEFVARVVGLSVLIGVLVFEEITPAEHTCVVEHSLNLYLFVAVSLTALVIANIVALGLNSAQGYIWDKEDESLNARSSSRRFVEPLVYMNIVLTLGELLWAFVGTAWTIRGFVTGCLEPGKLTFTDAPLIAVFVVIVLTWIGIAFKAVVYTASFNSCNWCQNSNVEHGRRKNRSRGDDGASVCCHAFSVCMKKSDIDLFREVANLFTDVFDDDDFVPTDIAAALLLLYSQERQNNAENSPTSTIGSPSKPEVPLTSSYEQWSRDMVLVRDYAHYAEAAYGYALFLYKNSNCRGALKLRSHLLCCGCLACFSGGDRGHIEGDNCLGCETAAIRASLPHVDDESIVHISFTNRLTEVPYFVAADHRHKKIVVAIRGTLSLADALTDLAAKPVPLADDPENPGDLEGMEAHGGMVKAARYVFAELRDKNILNKAFSYFDGYTLVVTGHSLGAGTASVLAFLLRRLYPDTVCYAYSPPGCVFNAAAAEASRSFVTSVTFGEDLVSRLSISSVMGLKNKMKAALVRCKLPKYQILANGLCLLCCYKWDSDPEAAFPDDGGGDHREDEAVAVSSESSGRSDEPIIALRTVEPLQESYEATANKGPALQEMMVPGTIMHVDRPPRISSTDGVSFRVSEKPHSDFADIVVSPRMLTDHLANVVCDVLDAIVENVGQGSPTAEDGATTQ